MSNLIQKMENKIKNQEEIPDFIQRIDDILKNNCQLLSNNLNFRT